MSRRVTTADGRRGHILDHFQDGKVLVLIGVQRPNDHVSWPTSRPVREWHDGTTLTDGWPT